MEAYVSSKKTKVEQEDDSSEDAKVWKYPAGPIKLAELPACKIPDNRNTGKYADYLWPLTEKGQRDAYKILVANGKTKYLQATKGKTKKELCFTHFCAACYEKGQEYADCLFDYSLGNQSNRPKHNATHTGGNDKWPGFEFQKIEEFRGTQCGNTPTLVVIGNNGMLEIEESPATRDEYLTSMVRWIAGAGLPLSTPEDPLFRQFLSVVLRVRDPSILNTTGEAVKKKALDLSSVLFREIANDLKGKMHRAFVTFDGWDGKQKIIGFSISYVKVRNGVPDFVNRPLSFAFAKLNPETNQMSGEKEIIDLLNEKLEEKGLSSDMVAGVMSDNAMVNTIANLNRPGLDYYVGSQDAENWDDSKKDVKIGCVSHLANLAVVYAIGDKIAKRDGENAIPSMPDGIIQSVQKVFQTAREANDWLSKEKNFQKASSFAADKNVKLLHPISANVTRWTSQFEMLRRAIDNSTVLTGVIDDKKKEPVLDEGALMTMAYFEAILEPLTIFQRVSQTAKKPFGPVTLPAIYLLLRRYGIKVDSIFDCKETKFDDSVLFSYRVKKHGGFENKTVSASSLIGDSRVLLDSIRSHLVYRFLKQRSNKRFFEVMGLFLHPLMKRLAEKVCNVTGEFGFVRLKKVVENFLLKFAPKEQKKVSTPTNVIDMKFDNDGECGLSDFEEEEPTPHLDEFSEYMKFTDSLSSHLKLSTFSSFVEAFEEFDPCEFWADARNQARFPTIFQANLVILAYQSSSAFQEGVFSTSAVTLTDNRNRLYDSPFLAEALVSLRHVLPREQSKNKYVDKEEVVLLEEPDQTS